MASSEYSPLWTLNPANSMVASEGIGMHALSSSISTKIPGRPSSATTSVAKLTSGSVSEAWTRTRSMRAAKGSVRALAVPLFDTRTPLTPLMPRLRERAAAVPDAGSYILGPEVQAFEAELASHLGVRHAIGVANGTDALTVALRAMGVGPGDDV